MKVALIQMDSTKTREQNEKKNLQFMRQAEIRELDVIYI